MNIPKPPLRPIVTNWPMKRWIIDFTEMTSPDPLTGHRYILTILDSNTKMLWTKAFRYKFAASVAQYLHKLFSYEGAPDVVQSDNGGEFIAGCVRALQQVHRIKKFINSSPHHPQTNGQVERVNQTIVNRLKAASNDDPNWSKYLVDATHNYNRDVHLTTGFCPLELHRPHLVLRKKVSDNAGKLRWSIE